MRRTPSRRLSAAALLVASVLTPVAVTPAAAVPSVRAERPDTTDYPRHALGPELSHRLDRAIEEVRREADIPGLVVGLWMPGKGHYVRATGVADTATGRPMRRDVFVRIGSETKTFTVTALLKLVDSAGYPRYDGEGDPLSADSFDCALP